MAGRYWERFSPQQGRRWIAPMKLAEPLRLPLAADVSEAGTVTPDYRSSYPHGPSGLVHHPSPNATPEQLNAVGTNVAYSDGATTFVPLEEMVSFSASWSGGVKGYWPYVSGYDSE